MRIRTLITALTVLLLAASARAATVTIQPGETLSHVASRYGMSVDALARMNGISDPNSVVAGTRLGVSGAPRSGASGGTTGGHVVRAGENLESIAQRYGTSASALATANGIADPNLVVAGTRLRLSVAAGTSRSRGSSVGGGRGGHVVRVGENLESIAQRYGTTASAIAATNGIADPHMIVAGARLRISGGGGGSSSSGSVSSGGHVVQPGENLDSIARRYGSSAAALAAANGIANPNMVVVGTRLRVTGSASSGNVSGMTQGPLAPVTAATHGWGGHPGKSQVSALISQYAARHGVDPSLVRAIGWQESGFWQGARSSTGAIGVMQLMPGTADWAGPALLGRPINPHNVNDNVEAGAAYIAYLQRQTGSRRLAIASYYQGWGSVSSRGLYGETENYVASVSSFIGRV